MKQPIVPHITEKSYRGIPEGSKEFATYTFKVRPGIDAPAVKKMVAERYSVTVTDVRMIHTPGKNRRFKGVLGRTSDVHKAIVRLKAGDRIQAFDLPEQPAETNA